MNKQHFNPINWFVMLVKHALVAPWKAAFFPPKPPEPTVLQLLEQDIAHQRIARLAKIAEVEAAELVLRTKRSEKKLCDDRLIRLGNDLTIEATELARVRAQVDAASNVVELSVGSAS